MDEHLHNLLLKSFDSDLTSEENDMLEKALDASEELRSEKTQLQNMRIILHDKASKSFRPGFEERVMARIKTTIEEDLTSMLFRIFRPVAVAAIMLIILLASFNIVSTEEYSVTGVFVISDASLDDAYDPLVDLAQEQ